MKPMLKFLVATGVCLATSSSYAHLKLTANPYLGLEYKLSYTQAKDNWNQLLPTNRPNHNGTIFAGLRFHKCLAGELGYTQSDRHAKSSALRGASMFGGTANLGATQNVKLKYRSWSFDLNGKCPSGDRFAFLGTLGFASMKPKLQINNVGSTANSSVTSITGKSKIIPRLGVGVQYTQGMFGIRSRVMWEGTSRSRFDTGTYQSAFTGGTVTDKPFKSSYAWTLGAFVRW